MDDRKELMSRVAYLEFVNDQLHMELTYMDNLLKMVGFSKGLESVKAAAEEFINSKQE